MAKIGIVTVLYNSETVLKEYFESLNNQTYKDFILYIIDNNSPDKSLVIAKELSKRVSFRCVFFEEKENWGVAKGNNIGISAALEDGCSFILLSNNDVVLDNSDTIQKMLEAIEIACIDILCPKIYYYSNPNIIWAAGGKYIKSDTFTRQFGIGEYDSGQFDLPMPIPYTPTCFVLIRAEVFEQVGLMDEKYFVYFDDTDFMYRAYKSKIKIFYSPCSSILHKESVSTGLGSPFQKYYIERNRLYFTKKNRPYYVFIKLAFQRLLALLLKHSWRMPRVLWNAELKGFKDGVKLSISYNIKKS